MSNNLVKFLNFDYVVCSLLWISSSFSGSDESWYSVVSSVEGG